MPTRPSSPLVLEASAVVAFAGTAKLIAARTNPWRSNSWCFGASHSPILPKRDQLGKSDCFEDRYSGRRPQLVPGTDFLRAQVAVQQSNARFTNESRFESQCRRLSGKDKRQNGFHRHFAQQQFSWPMSALPPKADIAERDRNVRFVPKANILQCGRNWHYSITSSARSSIDDGTSRPSEGIISYCGLCPLSGHAALEFAQPSSSI
jgi:hypothetical protein